MEHAWLDLTRISGDLSDSGTAVVWAREKLRSLEQGENVPRLKIPYEGHVKSQSVSEPGTWALLLLGIAGLLLARRRDKKKAPGER